jgi:hypothetical protein
MSRFNLVERKVTKFLRTPSVATSIVHDHVGREFQLEPPWLKTHKRTLRLPIERSGHRALGVLQPAISLQLS